MSERSYLAEAGLLDWPEGGDTLDALRASDPLALPDITVEPDAIYIRDGTIWSSGRRHGGHGLGAARLIEQDCGRAVAMHVARVLVVYLRRMGGQSQYSALLAAQVRIRERRVRRARALDC